ncbi:MAG TPA: sigma-70 family RNA polymerase sigma factor [Candidatus Binatia bacterium]|nr:sigma-70 family RNA polymerase sigma factor [Candidatus Binatia bacterium]
MSAKIIRLADAPSRQIEIEALTARMKAGEEDAFAMFHELYCDRLFRYLIVLCRGDEELSRDLLQITMLKVVRSVRRFTSEAEFWNWLAAIARNSFFDFLRRTRRMPRMEPLSFQHTADFSSPPGNGDEDAVLEQALEQALAQLADEERTLIDSFYFQSGTYRSVAQQQDTSAKAIESRLARVRQKLRHSILKLLSYENP